MSATAWARVVGYWLILSIRLNEAMARPIDDSAVAENDLHRYADEGVRVFLAAYRPTALPRPRPDPPSAYAVRTRAARSVYREPDRQILRVALLVDRRAAASQGRDERLFAFRRSGEYLLWHDRC